MLLHYNHDNEMKPANDNVREDACNFTHNIGYVVVRSDWLMGWLYTDLKFANFSPVGYCFIPFNSPFFASMFTYEFLRMQGLRDMRTQECMHACDRLMCHMIFME